VSWPGQLPANTRFENLAALTDLFGLATSASGQPEWRDGKDLLGALRGTSNPRENVIGMFGTPGTRQFKCMVRQGEWKYIWLANGGREQLFNISKDPHEIRSVHAENPAIVASLRAEATRTLLTRDLTRGALEAGRLKALPFEPFPRTRIRQFARGVTDFGQGPSLS
jgi:arylsulfatase